MENNYPYPVLLTCCICLLCIVVLAIVIAVVVFALKKRNQGSPEPLPPSGSVPPTAVETIIVDNEEATVVETTKPALIEEPTEPEPPVEAYAAQTIISSGPVLPPLPEEKPANPFTPGSIAAASWNVGFDVRELKMMGFTDEEMHKFTQEEIQAVLDNVISLAELRKRHQDS